MSFLSAAYLLALPLVAVPLLIHLYRGRQKDVILWGAMQFLASAVTKGRRMERLEEFILMLLRLAAVAALVFALARPMIRSHWLGTQTSRQVILILDNSLSMSREVDGESADARMKERAIELIDSLSAADGAQILLAAGSEWTTAEDISADSGGQERLAGIVESVGPTLGTADLLASLQSAVNFEAADELASRRIIVFTDCQADNWQLDAKSAWQQLASGRKDAEFPISIEVVECGLESEEIDNLTVAEVAAAQVLVRPDEPLSFSAEVRNMGSGRSEATRAQWLVDGKAAEEAAVMSLQPRGRTTVSATLRFDDVGVHEVTCRLDGADQVPLDQENSFVVEVADELPVLFVEGDEAAGKSVSAAELFAAALGYKGAEAQAWHAVYRPEVIPQSALATHALADYRAIVIDDVAQLDRDTLDRLDAFVRSGGGLWLALGEHCDPIVFNRDWFADAAGLAPLALDALVVVKKADDAAATIHPPSRDHAATVQLSNTTQLDIDEARIRQRWTFSERTGDQEAVAPVLESGDGQPLVVENYVGNGRVLVQAVPLGLEWSNLPLLKAYVVMVHDWLNFVTAPTSSRYNLAPGTPIIATAPADAGSVSAEVVTPSGRAIPLVAADVDFAPIFRYSQTTLPGTYRVRFKDGDDTVSELPFQVARDPNESDVRSLAEDARKSLVAATGLEFGETVDTTPNVVEAAPRREPAWGVFLIALVTLLAAELLMSSRLARLRHGFAVTSS